MPRPPTAGAVSLAGYLRFWGFAYLAITAGVALLTRERPASRGGHGENGRAAANGAEDSPACLQAKGVAGAAPAVPGGTPRRSARLAGAAAAPSPASAAPASHPLRGVDNSASLASLAGEDQDQEQEEEEVLPLREAYLQLWRVVRLPAVQASLCCIASRAGPNLPTHACCQLLRLYASSPRQLACPSSCRCRHVTCWRPLECPEQLW